MWRACLQRSLSEVDRAQRTVDIAQTEMPMAQLESAQAVERQRRIARLQGPILVLGSSGFIGANLLQMLVAQRGDVVGTASHLPAWRLEKLPAANLRAIDLLVEANLDALLAEVKPRTIFNCVAYGAYSFEIDSPLIYQTNFNLTAKLLSRLEKAGIACYIHAGSSSEYGDNAAGPSEEVLPAPNSDYGVSKLAAANLIAYYGRKRLLPCANLRLYSVYGPAEDSSRLIPTLIRRGLEGGYPEFVSSVISRDFVYVDDACMAFVDAALNLQPEDYGSSFNIGTGCKQTMADVAATARRLFGIEDAPVFTMPNRDWDVSDWFADPRRAHERLGWRATTGFEEGLARAVAWYVAVEDKVRYEQSSKRYGLDVRHSVSAVVSCWDSAEAIPVLYSRLKAVFQQLRVEYEIILVDDGSEDGSEEVIRSLSRSDRRVVGISHSRRFGAAAAFRSGMELSRKNACVLLEARQDDPPEAIARFVVSWREGYDVVYGIRPAGSSPDLSRWTRRLFYRVFDRFSSLSLPSEAGDFALLDKRVVRCLLRFPERGLYLRGLRAFVGFRQIGVAYLPDPAYRVKVSRKDRELQRRLGRAKGGLLSFSNTPLAMLSTLGTALLFLTITLAAVQTASRLLFPDSTPRGLTTVLLAVLFFGSINLFALGLLGEYIAKIFDEVKQRPHYIRRSVIQNGETRDAADDLPV